jgi:MoaA/NifB/PqqE/SkfB family radical SAM enzyme
MIYKNRYLLREELFGGVLIDNEKRSCKKLSKKEFKKMLNSPLQKTTIIRFKKLINTKGLQAPLTIKWGITRRCNLNCKTCYSKKKIGEELSKEEVFKVIDQLYSLGIPHIIFGGGEPLVRNSFLEIVEYATNKGFVVDIDTNGILLEKKLIDKLNSLGIKRIDISLDGFNEKTNDYIRGKGTFRKIRNSIKMLKSKKFYVGVGVVITSENLNSLEKIAKLLNKLKVDEVHFLKFKLLGNGKKNDFLFPKESWENVCKKIRAISKIHKSLKIYIESSRCGIMFKTATILPEGDVTFCPLYDGIASIGNVKNESFKKIWKKLLDQNKYRKCIFCGS